MSGRSRSSQIVHEHWFGERAAFNRGIVDAGSASTDTASGGKRKASSAMATHDEVAATGGHGQHVPDDLATGANAPHASPSCLRPDKSIPYIFPILRDEINLQYIFQYLESWEPTPRY